VSSLVALGVLGVGVAVVVVAVFLFGVPGTISLFIAVVVAVDGGCVFVGIVVVNDVVVVVGFVLVVDDVVVISAIVVLFLTRVFLFFYFFLNRLFDFNQKEQVQCGRMFSLYNSFF